MKKVLVFLFACLSSAFMLAQQPATYFQPVDIGDFNMQMYTMISLDDVMPYVQEGDAQYLEIGIFDQNGVCRGAAYPPTWKKKAQRYVHSCVILGVSGYNYTFRLYSHKPGEEGELETTCDEDGTLYFEANENAFDGTTSNPCTLHFHTVSAGSFTLDVEGYTQEKDNYYLIASPVGAVTAENVDGLRTPDFDFYSFDEAQTLEWINHGGDDANAYELQPGVGYLYANSNDVVLTFAGNAHTDDVTVTLAKTEGAEFEGWNLVGNPYGDTAYIDRPFYRMNVEANRSELISEPVNGGIGVMEGVFVIANEDGEEMAFSTTPSNRKSILALNLSFDNKLADRAIVNFGGGNTLEKFQLNPSHTKVYIPQEGKDYAVVSAGEMGEMPFSFKAERNGSYSLNFASEEVSFAYLHLIDNKTGNDVDLLETPYYSFDAQTTDYASRFKLVFATGNSDEDSFAFNSNGNWIISNEGEAVLQVVDVLGRVMSSEQISGCCSKAIHAAPGVYMLRLINGNNVKVQKVVVR